MSNIMDRNWMKLPRDSSEYRNWLNYFLNLAFANSKGSTILCPCKKCKNVICKKRSIVEEHLLWHGFLVGYTKWVLHGELSCNSKPTVFEYEGENSDNNMREMLYDAFGMQDNMNNIEGTAGVEEHDRPCKEAENFYKLMEDAEQELYPGCKNFSKLYFIVRMLQIKCLRNWSDSSFTMMLDLLRESFPAGVQLPKNYYETKKILKELGLNYKKIDACRNDCMLYWGVNEGKTKCDTCDESRWITSEHEANVGDRHGSTKISNRNKKIPAKVVWHFPLKPRLQRLFMNKETASLMKWHDTERIKDGVMRHPADSPAWKTFDFLHPEFAKDPRNVRLGLATDGFNPFRTMNVAHSTWPVILIPYNLPPGECMKKAYLMLSMLIPGPSGPGNNFDIFLQPAIAEIKQMWVEGINTYDESSKENFQLRAALLWTISDFPGLAAVSDWSTKGELACPVCHKYTNSLWLDRSRKFCYMRHRIFLPEDHPYRRDKSSFNGTEEHRKATPYLKGSEAFDEVKDIENKFGKKVGDQKLPYNWKKKSIFFDLPYWKTNLVRHNLDVMHIEKNVCDKVLFTLLASDKSKDNYNSRLDLQIMGIRSKLHPFVDELGQEWLPAASFALDKTEKERFCKILKSVKVPDGYASNVSRCVHIKPPKIFGLKSHDSHVLMQQLLPLALRKLLPRPIRISLIHLSRYFTELCSKTLHPSDLSRLEREIAIILCQLEKIFPPSFFDIMVHLTVHLVTEAKLAGPVQYRWMYPIERYLSTLKSYVRNRGRPEGSIAEGYLAEECLSFCSLYFDEKIETRHTRASRNDDSGCAGNTSSIDVFSSQGVSLWKGKSIVFNNDQLTKAHRYVLFNCNAVQQYRADHEAQVRRKKHRSREHEIKRIHSDSFATWFKGWVEELTSDDNDLKLVDIKRLARGPIPVGTQYKGFKVNGYRFHTKEIERKRKTQNSGVMVNASTTSFASKKDMRPILQEMTYYGIVRDIIELDYTGGRKVVLFDCDWVSKGSKLKEDNDGFTLTNFSNIKCQNEPFALANQVEQVFYVDDPAEKDWKVVVKTKARDRFDNGEDLNSDGVDTILQSITNRSLPVDEDEAIDWTREGASQISVNALQETDFEEI